MNKHTEKGRKNYKKPREKEQREQKAISERSDFDKDSATIKSSGSFLSSLYSITSLLMDRQLQQFSYIAFNFIFEYVPSVN